LPSLSSFSFLRLQSSGFAMFFSVFETTALEKHPDKNRAAFQWRMQIQKIK
jgi:hypothetical protein